MVSNVTVDNKEDQPCVKIAKKRLQHAVEQFRRQIGDQPARAMGEVLPADVVAAVVKEEGGGFRDRIYPPMTTLGLFIGQARTAHARTRLPDT